MTKISIHSPNHPYMKSPERKAAYAKYISAQPGDPPTWDLWEVGTSASIRESVRNWTPHPIRVAVNSYCSP